MKRQFERNDGLQADQPPLPLSPPPPPTPPPPLPPPLVPYPHTPQTRKLNER